MIDKPLVVCFTAGTSGHFIAYVISNMLYGTSIIVNNDGSAHDDKIPLYLPHVVIDEDPESIAGEIAQIEQIPFHGLAMAHTRHLCKLVELGARCVYITWTKDDVYQIKSNIKNKVSSYNENAYNIMAGQDWPPYPGFNNIPNWIKQEMLELNFSVLDRWRWIMPRDTSSCFEVKFKDVKTGDFVPKLAEFLSVTEYNRDYVMQAIERYSEKQNAMQ